MIMTALTSRVSMLVTVLLLTACDKLILPPLFATGLHKYAVDNGSDVNFTITVYNNPGTVSCFNTNVIMSNTGTNEWSGTAAYSTDLLNHASGENSGINSVSCTAVSAIGSASSSIGSIELIPDMAPMLVIIQPLSICGNDGTRQFNDALVDPSSTYIAGANYTLTQGTLPVGLSIDATTGKLIGTMAAGSQAVDSLAITATTVAAATESALFSISISSTPCP